MKTIVILLPLMLAASTVFGQSTTNAGKQAYVPSQSNSPYHTNYNNPDAGQSGYGYGNPTQSKAYNDRKVNGSEKDNVSPAVIEERRRTAEYNAKLNSEQKTKTDCSPCKAQ